jgi:hypothetical protein
VVITVKIDIADLAGRFVSLGAGVPTNVAVVVPLADGCSDVVREFLQEGPPFDPAGVGLERHQVFLTEREAVFVFDAAEGARMFERILAEPDFWSVVSAWEHCASEEPRLGKAVFEWPGHKLTPVP